MKTEEYEMEFNESKEKTKSFNLKENIFKYQ